jgi:diketogulonate reductase-like aldo/keto reductase
VITIPKASTLTHVRDNARSIDIELTKADLEDLERQFPAPRSKQPLAVL